MTITHCAICGAPTSLTGTCPSHPLNHATMTSASTPSDPDGNGDREAVAAMSPERSALWTIADRAQHLRRYGGHGHVCEYRKQNDAVCDIAAKGLADGLHDAAARAKAAGTYRPAAPEGATMGEDGPGTPAYRFDALMAELERRFPDAHNAYASDPPEPKLLAAIDVLRARAERAEKDLAESRDRETALDEACDDLTAKLAAAQAERDRMREALEEIARMHGSYAEINAVGYARAAISPAPGGSSGEAGA